MSLSTVPADILLEIADYLSCPTEILHLYLTVRAKKSHFKFLFLLLLTHVHSPHELPMRSPRPSIHASSCEAPPNA